MLVVHGENDYRVPVDQGLECYNVLQAQGRAVAARLLPRREPLGAEAAQLVLWYREVLAWLARYSP